MNVAGWVALFVSGAVVGWLSAVTVVRRNHHDRRDTAGGGDQLARSVLAETRNAYAILDPELHVLLANRRAVEIGVVRAGFPDGRIAEAAERAIISGEPVDVDLTDRLTRGAPSAVHAEVRQLSDGSVLVIAADESAAARVEAVRRDFVANISHELKTPISSISLLAEATLDGADDPDTVRHFTAKTLREATRLGALVTELIALSKLQGGSESMEQALVPVDAVIDETLSRTTTIAETAGITVAVGGTEGLFVRGDRMLLVTALVNLVDNAIHYSPHGTPVTINRALRDGVVEIAVTDRGTGIAAAYQERVFERFFRADPARSRDTGGTGLGLAIVKHVAANHGGQVSLWSRTGTGSTFTLKLPANSDDQHGTTAGSTVQPSVGTRFPTRIGSGAPGRARTTSGGPVVIRPLSTSSSPSAVIPSDVKPLRPAAMSDPISTSAIAPEQL